MEYQKLISLIIPFYNVEAYIENCLRSVLNQTYSNLEIILVDDGSKDESRSIADRVSENDFRVKIITRLNGGLSAARNTGLEAATGDFIFYLDSDDYLKADCIAKLYDALKTNNADIAQANFYYDYKDHLLYDYSLAKEDLIFDNEQAMWELLKQDRIKNFAWGKLIKSSLAKSHSFEEGKYFEDVFWKYKIIHNCHKYIIVGEPLIYYVQREASISGNFSLRNLDQLEGDAERLVFIKNHYPNNFYNLALSKFQEKLLSFYRLSISLQKAHQATLKQEIIKYQDLYNFRQEEPTITSITSFLMKVKRKLIDRKKWKKIAK